MKHKSIYRGLLINAAMILLGAVAMTGALSPAASDELRPFLQAMGIISCTSNSPCQEGKNAGKGAGLEGISAKGSGVLGQTTFKSTSLSNGQAGLIGQDISTSGSFNAGIKGTSKMGVGVIGLSTNNVGVHGTSTFDVGVEGFSSSGFGIFGISSSNDAVLGQSSSGVGVSGESSTGLGVSGVSNGGVGVRAEGGLVQAGFLLPALSVNGNGTNPDLIYACILGLQNPCSVQSGFPTPQFAVANNGNLIISGSIFTSGICSSGCAATHSTGEKRVRLFTPQESLPTVEDSGQAQLVGGRTFVRIDPAFSITMDSRAAYMVFITPLGDSNGLYVENETAGGFEVHENKGGHSTLMFSYRIVAKPFGQHAARLHMITVSKPGTSLPQSSRLE